MTKAEQFDAMCDDTTIYDFDPKATEDQRGDVHITTFSDGSRFHNNAATGRVWTDVLVHVDSILSAVNRYQETCRLASLYPGNAVNLVEQARKQLRQYFEESGLPVSFYEGD